MSSIIAFIKYSTCTVYVYNVPVYVKAQFPTQPVSKPDSRFRSRPAYFKTGWPDSWSVKGNGQLRNRLGGRLWNQMKQGGQLQNQLGGQLRNPLVDTNVVVTGQHFCWFWNWLGRHQRSTGLVAEWPTYASIVLEQLATLITKDIVCTVVSKFFTMNRKCKVSCRIFII